LPTDVIPLLTKYPTAKLKVNC